MPIHRIEVDEYECCKCGYKWINRVNGKDGQKPPRCAKCKRWDWEEGYMSNEEKHLRRDIHRIEKTVRYKFISLYGETTKHTATDLCISFLSLYPKPTIQELYLVLQPMCYMPRDGWGSRKYHPCHFGACWEPFPIQFHCTPGFVKDPEKTGCYYYDDAKRQEFEKIEEDVRHNLMQNIVDNRDGVLNKHSTHYAYLIQEKHIAQSLEGKNVLEEIARIRHEEEI